MIYLPIDHYIISRTKNKCFDAILFQNGYSITKQRRSTDHTASISFKLRKKRYGSKEAITSSWSLTSEP